MNQRDSVAVAGIVVGIVAVVVIIGRIIYYGISIDFIIPVGIVIVVIVIIIMIGSRSSTSTGTRGYIIGIIVIGELYLGRWF